MTTLFSAVQGSTTAGMWLAVLFLGAVLLVTVISLFRAERGDVPRVFELFARGFGFRRFADNPDNGGGNVPRPAQNDAPEAGA